MNAVLMLFVARRRIAEVVKSSTLLLDTAQNKHEWTSKK